MLQRFEDFLELLGSDLNLFRYSVMDLEQRYGERYRQDALLILRKLEEFAGLHGETLADTVAFYSAYISQVAENRRLFRGTLMKGAIPQDRRFKLQYLYALTLSTALNRSRYELFLDYRQTLATSVRSGISILEIGAGNCLDAQFASFYGKVRAYETNELSLAWRRFLDPDGEIDLSIAVYRFDEPRTYDLVTMIELLEHLEDPGACLANAERVLRDDGLAYLTFAIRMPQIDHHYNFMSIQECRDMLDANGFTPIREQCLIDTYMPFEDKDRWRLAEAPEHAVIYCCLAGKNDSEASAELLARFTEDIGG
ncbi:MAG TPA: methyltransferase domain-containing protein [Thermoanaerobaculia bacterium]|jgi:SAM-dependent methyltransferase|nr:methyltransferase domain-containing protein [Thermoanaerobaculia bacterium]